MIIWAARPVAIGQPGRYNCDVRLEVQQLKIIRTVFQDSESRDNPDEKSAKFILVLDMEEQVGMCTADIPNLVEKIETALSGIFPEDASALIHACGGRREHSFREEIEMGTTIPHLLEHVLLHLLSRRSNHCSGYCGQRSADLDKGIKTHYYLVLDYPSKLEAVLAADLGLQLVSAWIEGRTVKIDPATVLADVRRIIEPMVERAA